jgi:hypothetical protein
MVAFRLWVSRTMHLAYIGMISSLLTATSVSAQPLPEGLHLVGQSGPSGQALLSDEFSAPGSARALLPEVIRWVSSYFDRPLVLNGAIVDTQDQQVHAFFETVHRGQAVRGTLAVFAGGGRGSALLLFDRPDRFAQSSGPMLQQMMGGGGERAGRPAAPPRVEPLRQAVFPDGSGSIGLPEGWVITSYRNATAEAYGQGGNIALGVRYTVPVNALPGFPGIHGPMLPPGQALMALTDSNMRGALSRGEARMTIIEERPTPTQSGRAAYVHYQNRSREFAREGLALVFCSPVDYNHWQLYFSVVLADEAKFPDLFPTMWAMWKSWSINPAVFRAGMDEELANMREINNIWKGVSADAQRSAANRSYSAGQLLQGVTSIERVETQARWDVNANRMQPMLRALNQNGQNWQEVPLQRINPSER